MTTAYQTLSSLSERQATGEFICVGDDAEIHVFLQTGRLAWATLSTQPMEFVQYLQRNCAVDMEIFREALAHAAKTRAPVGETLVAWKLASWEDVRSALLHQMRQTMAALKGLGAAQTMFLERKHFAAYNADLTFTLTDVMAQVEPALPQPSPGTSSVSPGAITARQILDATPSLAWVATLDSGQTQDLVVNEGHPDQVPPKPATLAMALPADADFQAIRSPGGVLLGLRWNKDLTVCSWLPVYAAYGQTVATLFSLREASGATYPAAGPTRAAGAPWMRGKADNAAGKVLSFSDKLSAVVALDAHEALGEGAGRGPLSEGACLTMCTQISAALWAELPESDRESALQATGFHLRTVVARYKKVWCFGSRNPVQEGASIWLFLPAEAPQGLGWACLSAVLRDQPLLDALAAHTVE